MKLHFLGTSGWYDTKLGNTLSVLLDSDKAYIVFDAGGGFYKLDKYIKKNKPIILLISHFHLDHIIGLHTLNKFNFIQGINVFGPKGVRKMFDDIINTPYSMPIGKLRTKITVREFSNNLKLPVVIKYKKLRHSSICYGYRVFADGKSLVFCTDTGQCRNLYLLANGADVLIAESSLISGEAGHKWPHLNPEQAALVAKDSKVKKLFLVHFDAQIYQATQDRKYAERKARKIFLRSTSAFDGMEIEI